MRALLLTTLLTLFFSSCSTDKGASPQPDLSGESGTQPRVDSSADGSESVAPDAATEVAVNGERLDEATLQQFEQNYSVKVKPGRYWYDNVSGVWGLEGGPSAGIVAPGMRLGGPLRADSSNGDTGVFVNGRELHQLDVLALRRCVQTVPGRYWVGANGIGGYENGPPIFDLNALCNAARGGGGNDVQCEDYGGGQFNCARSGTRTGTYGVIGEGGGQAGVFTDQGLVMTPN